MTQASPDMSDNLWPPIFDGHNDMLLGLRQAVAAACGAERGHAAGHGHGRSAAASGACQRRRVSDLSHSNAHALCPHPRNLTDAQLRAVADSGGIAGLNFGTYFLRGDGDARNDTPIEVMLDHLDHMIDVMGVAHVGMGSDFDGVRAMPESIDDVASLPRLRRAMHDRGYDDATLDAICYENWLRVLERTWGE